DDAPAALHREQVATIARAEDRAAAREDARDVGAVEPRDAAAVRHEEALEPVANAVHLPAVEVLGRLHDGPDHGVEPGAVAAARQDRDAAGGGAGGHGAEVYGWPRLLPLDHHDPNAPRDVPGAHL